MSLMDKLFTGKPSPADVVSYMDGIFDVDKDISRRIMERIWWRNILYYTGEQWIEWVRGTSTFRRRILHTPSSTPVSNEIREFVRAVKSMLLNQKMIPRVVPNTNERADIDAAEVGGNLLIHMDSINDYEIEDEKEKTAICVSVFGTGFMRTIPFKEGGKWFIRKDGSVITTGDVVTENILPFNIIVDKVGDALRKKRFIGIQSLHSREWIEDVFKVKIPAGESSQTTDYQRKLMTLVGQVSPWKGSGLDYIVNDVADEELVTLRELEVRPTLKNPHGMYYLVCGGKLLQQNERMPIKTEEGYWTYSITDFHWNYVPGRFWSDSGVDDLISPQNSINEIDKSLKENREGLGRTTVISPGEIALKRVSEHGDQVLVLSYDGLSSGGGHPQFQQGIPLPNQVLEERMIHKQQIQELGGDPKNVLKGQAPSAHASGVMTDILRETAERGHYPDIERYNRSMSRVYKSRLLVAKEVYTEERMIKVQGKGNQVKVMSFKSSDLRGNTDVRMEIDSGLATTKAGQRSTLMDLIKLGVFAADIQTDPTIRHELIKRFGFSGFTDTSNADIDRAERENSMFAAGTLDGLYTVTYPVTADSEVVTDDLLFKYDTHAIHYEVHRKFMLDPEFSDLPPNIQAAAITHNDAHHLKIMAEKSVAMQEAMAMQGGQQGAGSNLEGSQPGGPALENAGGGGLEGGGGA